tara:strand:- start:1 stop:162 length:162 start_codon:yes stop_codon:yes gene_type:complete
MKKYKLTDISNQTIIYECEVMANSEEEAIEKAENWEEVSSYCSDNDIEVEEVE